MKLSNRTQGQLEDWIKGLFRAFDRLEKDCFFMPFLDDDVYLSIHGQEYYGHEASSSGWVRIVPSLAMEVYFTTVTALASTP